MSTANPFDLLGNEEYDDPSQLILAAEKLKLATPATKVTTQAPAKPGKLPTKPVPPSQAVKESKNEGNRGGGGARGIGRGRGRGRGGGESSKESFNNDGTYGGPPVTFKGTEEGEEKTFERRGGYGGSRGSFRGGRRFEFSNGDMAEGERPQRIYERHSGTGRDNGFKRDGAGRGNWGTPTDEIAPEVEESPIQKEKVDDEENDEEDVRDANKEKAEDEVEEKEAEAKEMTLEEYEKVLEEKRKALLALKTEERKVDDKEFKSMRQISSKKNNDEIFAKLGTDKDKRTEVSEKEEKARKSVNITEFLKPAERERSYGGRGRGRGHGPRGGFNGGRNNNAAPPPANIEDPRHFPALGC